MIKRMICLMTMLVTGIMFGNSSAEIKYSEIVNQLIAATTIDNAKDILKSYSSLDDNILRWHLADRQRLWYSEHGLYDFLAEECRRREPHPEFSIVVAGISLTVSLVSIALCRMRAIDAPQAFANCLFSTFVGLLGVAIGLASPQYEKMKKDLDEFRRIKELLTCIG